MDFDRSKGELRILGQRRLAMNVQELCSHLDQLVGQKVAEVIVKQHEYRLGKKDAEEFRKLTPSKTVRETLDLAEENDILCGVGVTRITLPEADNRSSPILVKISNPCVSTTSGSGRVILSSYWSGVISHLLGRECEAEGESYDEAANSLSFKIVVRD